MSAVWHEKAERLQPKVGRDRRSPSVRALSRAKGWERRFQHSRESGITAPAVQHPDRGAPHPRLGRGLERPSLPPGDSNPTADWLSWTNCCLTLEIKTCISPKLMKFIILSISIFIFNLCQGFARVFTATHFDILWLSVKFIPSRQPTQTAFKVFFSSTTFALSVLLEKILL